MIARRLRPVGDPAPLPYLRAQPGPTSGLEFPGWVAAGYASGTAALAAALLTATKRRASPRPRVILPAYSCPDVVSAAVFANAEVVLADTLPDSPWLDPAAVSALLTEDTVAVVYPRFLGLAANDVALRSTLAGSDVLLIEDRAHAFPQAAQLESCADLVVFSFGRGKPLPLRSGGALLQRADSVALAAPAGRAPDSVLSRAKHWLRCAGYNAGIQPNVYWALTELAGLRVDAIAWRELQWIGGLAPAIGELLPAAIKRYRAQGMRQQLRLSSLLQQMSGPWLDIPRSTATLTSPQGTSSVRGPTRLSRYPLLLSSESERDRAFQALWACGLGASRLYNGTLAELPEVSRFVTPGRLPNASAFAKRFLTLPLHSDVRATDFERMAAVLSDLAAPVEGLAVEQLRT